MKTKLKLAGAASLLAMTVASTTAVADPLDYLNFEQYAGWSSSGAVFNGGDIGLTGLDFTNLTTPPAPAGTFEDMSWSDPDIHTSSIHLGTFDSSNSNPDFDGNGEWNQGEWWAISQLIQTNNVLHSNGGTVPNPLWIVDTLANLFIVDEVGGDVLLADTNSKTTIEFWETSNRTNCGSPAPLGTNCDDIYRVAATSLAPLSFARDGYLYTINFALAPGPSTPGGLDSLVCTTGTCSGVDVPEGQIWVFTPEENPGTSSLFVTMAWNARMITVPEPSVLALFGIGMLGLGLAGRRRKQG